MIVEILIGILAVLSLAVFIMPRLLKRVVESRILAEMENARTLTPTDTDPLLEGLNPSMPALLYFTADWCSPCKTTQLPIIERLTKRYGGDLQLITVDVENDLAAAERWEVQSLPRTVVLRPGFHIHAINIGVTAEKVLVEQIDSTKKADGDSPIVVTRETTDNRKKKFSLSIGKRG